jgi:hypothetical protein
MRIGSRILTGDGRYSTVKNRLVGFNAAVGDVVVRIADELYPSTQGGQEWPFQSLDKCLHRDCCCFVVRCCPASRASQISRPRDSRQPAVFLDPLFLRYKGRRFLPGDSLPGQFPCLSSFLAQLHETPVIMPPTMSKQMQTQQFIQSTFKGNMHRSWVPQEKGTADKTSASRPWMGWGISHGTLQGITGWSSPSRAAYWDYLQKKLHESLADSPDESLYPEDPDEAPWVRKEEKQKRLLLLRRLAQVGLRKNYLLLIAIFLKTGELPVDGGNAEDGPATHDRHDAWRNQDIPRQTALAVKQADIISQVWLDRRHGGGDRYACMAVKARYNNHCVLTRGRSAQPALIIPHDMATNLPPEQDDYWMDDFWQALASFWPEARAWRNKIEETQRGRRDSNMLPLEPSAMAMWNRLQFALRPIADPSAPKTSLFLQLIWLKNFNPVTGLVDSKGGYPANLGPLADGRAERARENHIPIHTGDVFKLTSPTEDTSVNPESHPLPGYTELEIQYHLNTALFSIVASDSLELLFRGPPPDIPPFQPTQNEMEQKLRPDWDFLIQEAMNQDILDERTAYQWRVAFVWLETDRLLVARRRWTERLAASRDMGTSWKRTYYRSLRREVKRGRQGRSHPPVSTGTCSHPSPIEPCPSSTLLGRIPRIPQVSSRGLSPVLHALKYSSRGLPPCARILRHLHSKATLPHPSKAFRKRLHHSKASRKRPSSHSLISPKSCGSQA